MGKGLINNIILLGGGGHCKSVIDSLNNDKKYKIYGIVDNFIDIGESVYGVKVIGRDGDLQDIFNNGIKYAFITVGSIGYPKIRKMLYERAKEVGFKFPVIQDKSAIVASEVKIDEGVFIGKGAIINANTEIGSNCIINSGSIIEHDCKVGVFSHVSPGATICGNVNIGNYVHVGCNATVIQGINIGENSMIGAGSVILKNTGDNKKIIGNPGREVLNE